MSDHSSSVFNNSCLKLPQNKKNRPSPVFEQKYLNQLQNEATKLNLEISNETMKTPPAKTFIEFVDSIPDYDDVNHLSNKDFYMKLDHLRQQQRNYSDYMQCESKIEEKGCWLDEYKDIIRNDFKTAKKKTKPFCVTPILSKSPKYGKVFEDTESMSEKEVFLKPSSRRSVRIETPSEKLSGDTPSDLFKGPKSRLLETSRGLLDWDNISSEELTPASRSAPTSPLKTKSSVGWKDYEDSGITIPKPFEMTVRDEENQIVEELLVRNKSKTSKPEMFKAHPVPIESQIPLFEKIMEDQERKNKIVRERSKALLQAQMQPFSFTKRDEEIQKLTKGLSKSSPSLFEEPVIKYKKFRAKPIPRNLFSNYIYQKMHEDEFYRALQRKIRAEEMLRAASLPPSMAQRERSIEKYNVCPRSYRDVDESKDKPGKYMFDNNFYEKELEDLKNEFLGLRPYKNKAKKYDRKHGKKNRNFSASSTESRTVSSAELQSVNRSNLAAVLRIQSAQKRLETSLCQKLEEVKLKEEARWREKIMRKKPIWQALAYSHEEDLAMRLQLRKDEEKLRSEEHRLRMQLMLGRVNQQPTLFERQSQVKYLKSKKELLDKLYLEYKKDAGLKHALVKDLPEAASSESSKESCNNEEKA